MALIDSTSHSAAETYAIMNTHARFWMILSPEPARYRFREEFLTS